MPLAFFFFLFFITTCQPESTRRIALCSESPRLVEQLPWIETCTLFAPSARLSAGFHELTKHSAWLSRPTRGPALPLILRIQRRQDRARSACLSLPKLRFCTGK